MIRMMAVEVSELIEEGYGMVNVIIDDVEYTPQQEGELYVLFSEGRPEGLLKIWTSDYLIRSAGGIKRCKLICTW